VSVVAWLGTFIPVESDVNAVQGADVVLSLRHEPLTANAVAASLLQSKLTNVERLTVLEALGLVYAENSADQEVAQTLARTAGITGRLGLQLMAKAVCQALDVPAVAARSGLKETTYARALATINAGAALLLVQAETLASSLAEEQKNGPPSLMRAVATLELIDVLSEVSDHCESLLEPAATRLRTQIESAAEQDGPSVA
jgi:hypothetical protein